METQRIQKWLAHLGIASRREAESWLRAGRISINGKVSHELGIKITPGVDSIAVDGKPVVGTPPPRVYWMLNKPDEVLTAREDGFCRTTIYDLPKLRKAPFLVSPVGRLDYRTEGLLLMTNDGELSKRLCHPKYKVPRLYHVLINGRLTRQQEDAITRGVKLEDGVAKGVALRYAHGHTMGASRGSWYMVTVSEGRNRLVRRLFESQGFKVVRLLRVALGDLKMPENLLPGDYRQLNSLQIHNLRLAVGLESKSLSSRTADADHPRIDTKNRTEKNGTINIAKKRSVLAN